MAIDLLTVDYNRINGMYKINTSLAYRGCAAYVSGVTSEVWYVALPTTSAHVKLCKGVVMQWPLVETGADTSDAIDKLAKNSRVCYVEGPAKVRLYGNALAPIIWASAYWGGNTFKSTVQSVATATWKNAYISIKAGHCGKWTATCLASETGITAGSNGVVNNYIGAQAKIIELTGSSSRGAELQLDIDWDRHGSFVAIS